ncbi:aspartic peptidase domain-containing protein [Crucibulum laeve]|uniref:Aspartic peptidase domain-containing protein n=1 Tax=Crucibulum laeve TaxID=68775 RepID=A0A5C3MFV8_9AGAR|nr:aspartic peptidase domain-containing protein [Crucibulum laeve]
MKLAQGLTFALTAATSSAYRFTVKQVKSPSKHQPRSPMGPSDLQLNVLTSSSGGSGVDLSTMHDLIYMANITIGGTDYPVQLDTGSSDLWIQGDTHPIPNTTETALTFNLTYAIGWAFGHVAYAPVEFVGMTVPKQAFLDVSEVLNPALGYGAKGIVGLGFTSLSTIDALVNTTNSADGRSFLYNLFDVHPEQPNFLAFALQRSTEVDDDVEGSFAIGEYDPQYSGVVGNAPIPTWPINSPKRWNVLLDALIVNDTITTPTTVVPGAPSNKAVVLLDSGASWTYAPESICDAIYKSVPGARFDTGLGQWIVPCDAEINMALQIGGQVFPIHPLDITPVSITDATTCLGSFVPQPISAFAGQFDWLIGDNFLRSVYSVYDFGDFDSSGKMGNPYMKLLSIIDPDEASIDFHKIRGGTPRTNITFTGLDGVSVAPSFSISNDISASLERIGTYLPAMLGIVALNALILIVLSIAGFIVYCRKQKRRGAGSRTRTPVEAPLSLGTRTPMGRMSPMPMNTRNSYIAGVDPSHQPPHVYEPVSMALTEDTFIPPSPAFHLDGSKLQPGDRPKSVA